jgi:hypothetical protein
MVLELTTGYIPSGSTCLAQPQLNSVFAAFIAGCIAPVTIMMQII